MKFIIVGSKSGVRDGMVQPLGCPTGLCYKNPSVDLNSIFCLNIKFVDKCHTIFSCLFWLVYTGQPLNRSYICLLRYLLKHVSSSGLAYLIFVSLKYLSKKVHIIVFPFGEKDLVTNVVTMTILNISYIQIIFLTSIFYPYYLFI